MKKRTIKARGIFTLLSLFLVGNIIATDYYVSNNGSDNNNGTSVSTPWKTVAKVNTASFSPGDQILFQADGTWRENLDINNNGASGNYIKYSRYGTGANPRILGSDQALNWTNISGNIWRSGTTLDNYSDEYYSGRIFFIDNADSVSWGQFRGSNTANLTQEYDYVVSGGSYYVYAPTNPGTRYKSVEVTQRRWCISIGDNLEYIAYIEVNGIDFMFSRMAGFYSGYPEDYRATDLVFRNCRVGYIGAQPSGFAYGIEAWHSNFLVEDCYISDCGRRGISFNLYLASRTIPCNISNVIIRNNVFKRGYHTTSLDLSSQQTSIDQIRNVYFYNNIVDDSDFDEICDGCTSNQVYFQNGSGNSLIDNVYVVGNVFIEATARSILFEGVKTSYVWNNTIIGHNPNITNHPYNNVVWNSDEALAYYRNNILYDNLPDNSMQNHGVFIYYTYDGDFIEKDYNLYHSLFPKTDRNIAAHRVNNTGGMGYWRTTEWAEYLAENTLFEQHSPVPANPGFENYNSKNYHLTSSSPAVGAGLATPWVIVTDPFGVADTINKRDIEGVEYSLSNWDIGAYAYLHPDSTVTENREPKNDIISIYPNPVSNSMIIELSDKSIDNYSIQLYNVSGAKIYEREYSNSNSQTINVAGFSKGIYLIKVIADNLEIKTAKIIIQ